MTEAVIPLVLEGMDPTTLRALLSRALEAVGDRIWSGCGGFASASVSVRFNEWQFVLAFPEATLFFERIDPVIRVVPGPAGVLTSWIGSTHHAVPGGSDGCHELRRKLDAGARLMTLACALAGRDGAMGWADNVRDHDESVPACRFGWSEGDSSYAAPPELMPMLEHTSPAYRSYGPSLAHGEWTIMRDRMAAFVGELDPMWMLRWTAAIPPAAIDALRTTGFRRYRR